MGPPAGVQRRPQPHPCVIRNLVTIFRAHDRKSSSADKLIVSWTIPRETTSSVAWHIGGWRSALFPGTRRGSTRPPGTQRFPGARSRAMPCPKSGAASAACTSARDSSCNSLLVRCAMRVARSAFSRTRNTPPHRRPRCPPDGLLFREKASRGDGRPRAHARHGVCCADRAGPPRTGSNAVRRAASPGNSARSNSARNSGWAGGSGERPCVSALIYRSAAADNDDRAVASGDSPETLGRLIVEARDAVRLRTRSVPHQMVPYSREIRTSKAWPSAAPTPHTPETRRR